jgi:hypothetical protein
MNPEMKFFDTNVVNITITAAGVIPIQTCVNMTRGTGVNERIGERAQVRSIQLKYEIKGVDIDTTDVDQVKTEGMVRVLLVQDTQCNGTAADVNDVLRVGIDNGAGTPNFIERVRNLTWSERFRTLYDNYHFMDSQYNTTISTQRTAATVPPVPAGQDITVESYNYNVQWKRIRCEKYMKVQIPIQYDNLASTATITDIRSNNLFLIIGCDDAFDEIGVINALIRVRYTDQ